MSKKIIACIDGSASSTAVSDAALWASQYIQLPLTFLHVLDKGSDTTTPNLSGTIGLGSRETLLEELTERDEKNSKQALQRGKDILQQAERRLIGHCRVPIELRQRHGELIETLEELDRDTGLLIVGREGNDIERHPGRHIGANIEAIIRESHHHPVLVALPNFVTPQKAMIAFDGSKTMQQALTTLLATNVLQSLECHIVMVSNSGATPEFNAAVALLKESGVTTVARIAQGDVDALLTQHIESEGIDLLIMGAYGHSRIRQLLIGSTTTKLINSSAVSMLLLR
ncbi:universal stress protein [Thaumasiovibrio sp. DFM-14]|uniref:universal stress protein n=1 Tax=Thaumasiovibrio sp. DFM-14 TaxID=3384792 RepID=UPI00399FFED5